jgi:hypothetical protein
MADNKLTITDAPNGIFVLTEHIALVPSHTVNRAHTAGEDTRQKHVRVAGEFKGSDT